MDDKKHLVIMDAMKQVADVIRDNDNRISVVLSQTVYEPVRQALLLDWSLDDSFFDGLEWRAPAEVPVVIDWDEEDDIMRVSEDVSGNILLRIEFHGLSADG